MTPRRAALYGLAGVGAAAAARGLYRTLTPEEQDVLPERLSAPVPATGSTELAPTLAANLNAPLLEGNRATHLVNGREIFPAMLDAIRASGDSVNLLTYIYWQGEIAGEFADALSAAAERGVEVRVLLDALGCAPMDDSLVERMRRAGCRVERFHQPGWRVLRRLNYRTHRKVMVVDGRVGFTGGVGIASEWTGDAGDPDHWRDDHFRLEGPVVRYLQGAFAENWRQTTGEVVAGERMYPRLDPRGSARMIPLLGTPGGSVSEIAFLYWLTLEAARREVRVTTPYFAPDPPLARAIAAAAGRGVRITLLLPGDHNDSRLVRWASRTFYRELLEAGVAIFEYQPTMLHVKAVTVDGSWSIFGSSNFDNRSFELNYEITIAAEDEGLAAALDESFESDVTLARPITTVDLDRRSIPIRCRDRGARLLREQL